MLISVFQSTNAPPAGNNWGLYNDAKADELCNNTRLEFEPDKRDQAIARLHEYIVDQSIWIWVVHDLNPRALSPKVKGFVPPQAWYVDFTTIDIA